MSHRYPERSFSGYRSSRVSASLQLQGHLQWGWKSKQSGYSIYGGLYLDIVALIAGFEDDSLELFDPHFGTGCRVGAEMVDSIYGDEFELFFLWISNVHFGVQGIPKVYGPAGEIQVLILNLNNSRFGGLPTGHQSRTRRHF
jgi:hypothetical protein